MIIPPPKLFIIYIFDSSRVAVVVTGTKKSSSSLLVLPHGVSVPYTVLADEPVSLADINLVSIVIIHIFEMS